MEFADVMELAILNRSVFAITATKLLRSPPNLSRSGNMALSALEKLKLESARAREAAEAAEAAAKKAAADAEEIAREIAELERLAAKYNVPLGGPGEASSGMTIRRLSDDYQSHPQSSYQQLRHRTRTNSKNLVRYINEDCSERKLALMKAPDFQALHDGWVQRRGRASAHALITQVRTMVSFGVEVLADRDCERAALILHKMQFAPPKHKRSEPMSAEDANRIREHAHKMGVPSLALAQALQFDCNLSQVDTIGEWVPFSELGKPTEVVHRKKPLKWQYGLRWEEIDENLMLHHTTSFQGKQVQRDLMAASMVKEELEAEYGAPLARAKLPANGPMIVFEKSKQPWTAPQFRVMWRAVAKAAGVPDNVKNRNSRKTKGSHRSGWDKVQDKQLAL
jgi:hypothetical protein